jgi:hypothetical protein
VAVNGREAAQLLQLMEAVAGGCYGCEGEGAIF